jgi:hypothetical protein
MKTMSGCYCDFEKSTSSIWMMQTISNGAGLTDSSSNGGMIHGPKIDIRSNASHLVVENRP